MVFNVALAALLAVFLPGHLSADAKATIDSTRVSLGGPGIASCFAAYFAFQSLLLSGDGMRTSLSDPGILRAVAGAGAIITKTLITRKGLRAYSTRTLRRKKSLRINGDELRVRRYPASLEHVGTPYAGRPRASDVLRHPSGRRRPQRGMDA